MILKAYELVASPVKLKKHDLSAHQAVACLRDNGKPTSRCRIDIGTDTNCAVKVAFGFLTAEFFRLHLF